MPRLLALFLALAALLRADIAPTTFTGTDILPMQSTDIRMAGANVRITWGQPCALEATFSMVNETDEAKELEVGFPVGAYHPDPRGPAFERPDFDSDDKPSLDPVGPEAITITVNGSPVPAFHRAPPGKFPEAKRHYATWYFARISFRPGPSLVTVHTRLEPSPTTTPYQMQLSYCLSTGGKWKGPIGWESVEIVFPGLATADFVQAHAPAGGKISGDSVRWDFTEFEPHGDEYDVDLRFLSPPVAAKLAAMKAAHDANPADTAAALRYANHLFCLGQPKGNSGFPPESFAAAEFQKLLDGTKLPEDRALLTRFYQKKGDRFSEDSSEWTPDRKALVRVLGDAGYCADYPGLPHVLAARALVEQCLAREPRNADAWNLYLTHFWRFSFGAAGHWFGPTAYNQPLRTAIESAYKNCPKDPRIRAWRKALKENAAAPSLPPAGKEYTVKADAFKNEF